MQTRQKVAKQLKTMIKQYCQDADYGALGCGNIY